MLPTDLGHLGDELTNRRRITDKVVLVGPDIAVQADEIEAGEIEERLNHSIQLGGV